jgi:hypothetical protein
MWRVLMTMILIKPPCSLVSGDPNLVGDYRHHKQKVEAQGPEDDELGAFEVTARDGIFFGFDQLVVFEGREDPGLIGSQAVRVIVFHHKARNFSFVPTQGLKPNPWNRLLTQASKACSTLPKIA